MALTTFEWVIEFNLRRRIKLAQPENSYCGEKPMMVYCRQTFQMAST